MTRIWRYVFFFLLAASAVTLLLTPARSAEAIQLGLEVCSRSILPSLFPFFVLTELWISLGCCDALARRASPWMIRLFHLPGACASALVLGAIGGYPVGARTAASLCKCGRISQQDAEAALVFCSNAGPAFIFGVMGQKLFGSISAGAAMWGIHLLTALLLGLLFRPPTQHLCADTVFNVPTSPSVSAFTDAAIHAGKSTASVCVFVLLFCIITTHLKAILPETLVSVFILSSLELAGGTAYLAAAVAPPQLQFVLAAALLGWGGLCVHCQAIPALTDAGLSVGRYLSGKALHGLISGAAACLAAPLLPLQTACVSTELLPFSVWPGVLLLGLGLLLAKSSSGKKNTHRV